MSRTMAAGRSLARMASRPPVTSPYTRAVVNAMRQLYPEVLADKSFDNTGLLLEAPFDPQRRQSHSVLLTVDLTKAVADEAIARKDSIIVAYHPIIFRGLKSLTFNDTQQQSLLRLVAAGISVYSPHTAIDCANGGLGDWLADIVTGTPTDISEIPNEDEANADAQSSKDAGSADAKRSLYMLQHHPSQLSLKGNALELGSKRHQRYPIQATTLSNHPGAGMGRIVRLAEPVNLTEIINRIGLGLGNPKGFPIAVPQGKQIGDMMIRSVAICAGSGGHLFGEMDRAGEDVDLLFTGELSHHEALAAIEKGRCVITLFHSNTERGFLHSVLRGQLEKTIREEWDKTRDEESSVEDATGGEYVKMLSEEHKEVFVSEADRDPYGIMILEPPISS